MKKNKRLITLILSAVLWISSVSPAFGAEFFSPEEVSGEESVLQEVLQEEIPMDVDSVETAPEESVQGEMISEETFLEEAVPEAGSGQEELPDADGNGEDADLFSDTEASPIEEGADTEQSLFEDSASQELLQGSDEKEFICTGAPIKRKDVFTPIGNGCDTPLPEEVIAQAGPELFTSGSESDEVDPADVAALIKARDELRNAMVNRLGKATLSLKFSFDVDSSEWDYVVYSLLLMAFSETGNSWEGDYLRWQLQETEEFTVVKNKSTGAYEILLPFVFYTTAAQEKKVTAAVNNAISGLGITDKTTPYLRIKKVYDYVCSTVTYDEEHCQDSDYIPQFTAYGAIIDKTAVCQGYSLLLYRMLMEVGIENRMIPSQTHIWNLVLLRGVFYNVDATWDSGVIPEYYMYFLKGSDSFETDEEHIRDTEDPFGDYNSKEFHETYPTSASDYTVQQKDVPENGECTHLWGAWEMLQNADCVNEGFHGRVCQNCGEEDYAVIPKTAHKWKYTASKTKNNTHVAQCSVCKTSKTLKCVFKDNICARCKRQRIPGTPKITKVRAAGYNKLTINWSAVEGATGYVIYYQKGSSWVEVGRTAQTSYTHKSTSKCPVRTGAICYFRVKASCTVNNKTTYGVLSGKSGGKTMAARPVLVSVKAKAYNKVALTWKKAAGATHYLIYRKKGSKWERIATVQGGNTTSYVHTGTKDYPVYPGTVYTYTVRSYTKTGNTYGFYDKTGKNVKTYIGKPSLTVSRTQKGLKTTWKKVNGATGYRVQRYANGKWTVIKTVDSKTLSFVDTKTKKGASYRYRVCAYRVVNKKRVYGTYSVIISAKR